MKDQLKYFKKNFRLLQKIHPSLAHQLSMVDPSDLEFCWTQQKESNLKRVYKGDHYYYHSPISAIEEAQIWFQSLDLHQATAIFVYGIGLGYYYQATKAWLNQHPHHALIFLEEDLSVLYRLCETELGCRLLKDPQVQVILLRNDDLNKSIFNELSWTYFKTAFVISCLQLYNAVNPEGFLKVQHELFFQFERKKAAVDEYLQFGVIFFRNFYSNLLQLPKAYWGNGLFNCFPQVPAIICGAGPSLNKNIDLLPGLKDRALIFAGGSALNALIPKGIIPHFGVAIDPNIYQYSRITITQPYHTPFFYSSRLFHEALAGITGPRLYLTGAGGYTTPDWFEKQLNIEGENLDGGHNVVNFSIEIAQALGCNPIIIVGTDLAFTNQEYYADGIAASLSLTKENFTIDNNPDSDSSLVLRNDIEGKPVYTLWKWINESEWISDFTERHPEITLVNATEGGLGFKNVANIPLQEVAEQFLKNPQDKIARIDEEIQKHPLRHISPERVLELLQQMKESLNNCVFLSSKLLENSDRLVEQIQQDNPFPPDLRTPAMTLLESDLEEEIGYQFLLNIFNQIFIRLHHREIQDMESPKRRLSEKKHALQKIELDKQRFVFLHNVAHFNRELIQRTIEDDEIKFIRS